MQMVRNASRKADGDGQSARSKLEELESHSGQHHRAVSSTMPLLNRCCCFSLLTGAVLTGIYATVIPRLGHPVIVSRYKQIF